MITICFGCKMLDLALLHCNHLALLKYTFASHESDSLSFLIDQVGPADNRDIVLSAVGPFYHGDSSVNQGMP